MESSRQDLLHYMAEHRLILIKDQNTTSILFSHLTLVRTLLNKCLVFTMYTKVTAVLYQRVAFNPDALVS